jgi:asparagine synthase (glutamine-hydrolysing)
MLFSVENRSPYLDRRLAEFAYTIPPERLARDGMMKWPLRQAASGLVPERVRLDARKRGFNASIESLIDRRDAATRSWLLDGGPVFDLVDRSAFEEFLDGDFSSNSYSKFLFGFVSAKAFLDGCARGPR